MARNDFDDFFGDDDTTPVTDTRADGRLYRVPLARVTANLVNPRTDFGTEDQLIDLGKSLARRQNQPCPVVSRNAYLKLWPEHAARIRDVDYVLVSGERRYRAANLVGLAALDCVANDSFAADRRTFMEAVVSENVDRQNFDPVEEAYAVQALVAEFGSNRAVAQHFERVDGWVTQRILLTHLAPPVQDLVRQKAIPLEAARSLGKLARDNQWDADQQAAWWQEEQDRRAAASLARAQAKKASRQDDPPGTPMPVPQPSAPASEAAVTRPEQPAGFTAVKPAPTPAHREPAPEASEPGRFTAVNQQAPTPEAAGEAYTAVYAGPATADAQPAALPVPEQRPEPIPAGRTLPYDDGQTVARHLVLKMDDGPFEDAFTVWIRECWDKLGPERSAALLRLFVETAAQHSPDTLLPLLREQLAAFEAQAVSS